MSFRKLIILCLRVVRVSFALLAMLSVADADPITAFAATWYGAMIISAAISAASFGIEYALTPKPKQGNIDIGRNDAIQLAFSGYGVGIPIIKGRMQVGPLWIWNTPIRHTTVTTPGQGGGKGFPHPTAPTNTQHIYTVSLAGLLCEGPIQSIVRIWIGTDLVFNAEAGGAARYEAESGSNTLAGGASVTTCSTCSGGHKVTGVGSGGSLQFNGIVGSSLDGDSGLAIFYTSTVDRTMKMSIDGGSDVDVDCPASGGTGIVAIVTANVTLDDSGPHTIKFSNAGAACPDIDKIEVMPPLFIDPGGPCPLGQHLDPDSGRCVSDIKEVTGAFNENIVPSMNDPNVSWPFYNYLPAESSGVGGPSHIFNISKYGQPSIRIYQGTETQTADSAIIADKGIDLAPAYRGYAYIVFENLQLPNGDSGLINTVRVEVDQGENTADLIVSDIYDRVGVDSSNIDVTALESDSLVGFIIPSRQQASRAITDLQTCFQFDMVEIDGQVVAVKRNGSSVASVSYTDLRAFMKTSPEDKGPEFDMLISDMDELITPGRVDLNYLSRATDYHQQTQTAMRLTGDYGESVTVTLPMALDDDQAKQLAETLLYKPDLEGRTFTWTEGPKSYQFNPSDVKTFTLQSGSQHTVRITKQSLMLPIGVAEYEGVRQSASLYSPTGSGSVGTGFEPPVAGHPANSAGVIIDGPLLRPEDGGDGTAPVVYIASCVRATGQGNGGGLYLENPIDSGVYSLVTTYDQQSGIGVSDGALGTVADPTVLDTVNDLEINFVSLVELSSASGADILANPSLNLLWIGSDGYGEYIQFETAAAGTAVAPYVSNYTISNLYRGRFGTENEVSIHTSTDDVVVIDSTIRPRRMSIDDIGVERQFKWVTSGQAEPDAQAVPFTLVGRSLQPALMTDPVITLDASNDWLITATDHPTPGEEGNASVCEVWDGTGRTDPGTHLKRTLQMITGTTQAAILSADYTTYTEGTANTTSWAFKNNLLSHPYGGVTIQKITQPYQRFDFSMKAAINHGDIVDLDGSHLFQVALQHFEDSDIGGGFATVIFGDAPLSVEWTYDPVNDIDGTVTETIRSFSTVLKTTHSLDPGYGGLSIASHEAVETGRPGPRYTILLNGNEFAIYRDFKPSGGNIPLAKMTVNPIDYPLRLVGMTTGSGGSDSIVRSIMFGGSLFPSTIYARREQIEDFGSEQSTLHLRLYQIGRFGMQGRPLDITVP